MGWFGIASQHAAYAAPLCLTLMWGMNWAVMKVGLQHADPMVFNIERTWLAIATLFAVLLLRHRRFWPESWLAVCVTGFFQTTINFGATAMALASGGTAALNMLAIPVIALISSMLIFGERLTALEWPGIASIGVGLAIISARAWKTGR
jgi:drug/metabolite transporter (DMT)-like permease